ncbi:MAG: murein L,D-transpeptidase catalytic domain family protein [Syntrophobacteraceae bacterium]
MDRLKHPCFCLVITALLVLLPWPNAWLDRGSRAILRPLPPPPPTQDKSVRESEAYWIALRYFKSHRSEFRNRKYLTIIDYSKPSTSKRLYLVDTESGAVWKYLVSHGKNSGWVYARRFSNVSGSFQSSKGFFRTGGMYNGKLGACLQLHGLQKGVNDNALSRGIVMHGAHYAGGKAISLNRGRLGRSLGCPALPREVAPQVMEKIKNGSLLYIHSG